MVPSPGFRGQRLREHGEYTGVDHLRHVEAHELGRRLRKAEDVAGGEHEVLVQRRAGKVGGIETVRQAAPEIEAAAWHEPWPDAERRQLRLASRRAFDRRRRSVSRCLR